MTTAEKKPKTAKKPKADKPAVSELIDPPVERTFKKPLLLEFKTEQRRPEDLTPYFNNAKAHSTEQIDKIAGSIAAFKFSHPIEVDINGVIITGHGRREAALRLKMATVPVVVRSDLTEQEANQYRIADNQVGESEWLKYELSQELKNFALQNLELGVLGFDTEELQQYLTYQIEELPAQLTDPDAVPEPLGKAVTQRGDVWLLGDKHRVKCGDSTVITDVESLMAGQKADLVFSSPPYCFGDQMNLRGMKAQKKGPHGAYLSTQDDDPNSWLSLISTTLQTLLPLTRCLIFNLQQLSRNKREFIEFLYAFRNNLIDVAIWTKNNPQPAMAENVLNSAFEYILLFSPEENPTRAIPTAEFRGTVSNHHHSQVVGAQPADEPKHGARMPLELAEWSLTSFLSTSGVVLDPFGGTGTTLIAADRLNHQARIMEIEPVYVDICVRRWQEFTGQDAIRESDGACWLDLKMEMDAVK